MKPVIALVGRPNVGKSTLFNCLTRSRDALVADVPGLTRDRKYGDGRVGDRAYIVIDTGGLSGERDELDGLMAQQAQQAIEEADVVLWLLDSRAGLTAADHTIADFMRRCGKQVYLLANKIDGLPEHEAIGDFFELGLGKPLPISASHGRGITQMMEAVLQELPQVEEVEEPGDEGIKVALIGRPNVGKSTLLNRMLGEQRVVAFDQPGTTRDSIYVAFERDGQHYTLIDTAGIRRRGKTRETVEKFSVVKALQAITDAHVVILLIDGQEGVTDQDLTLLGEILQQGRALIVAVNKWDGLPNEQKEKINNEVDRQLNFIDFAELHYISALHGSGVGNLFKSIDECYASATRSMPTPFLNKLLEEAIIQHQPPLVNGRRVKLRYAHQGGKNPPIIVIHGNQIDRLGDDYKRYLAHHFQKRLKLKGTPVKIELKSGDNPYKGKRNKLTPSQEKKRARMLRFVKKAKR
ncbi:MAG: ribosome biogenesis GTPase Der [Gammaproteobacteria bacterium]|nr:ribosome biogenesis GTPase Der [Gammaproteobacteria bacterium]